MENQHRLIAGYSELDAEAIASINYVKGMAAALGEHLEKMGQNPKHDQRWLAIGRTHLQQGFMAVIRSIAKPEGF